MGRTKSSTFISVHSEYLLRDGQRRKHRVQQFCCVSTRHRENLLTEPLPIKVWEDKYTDTQAER
jgi:hypothetical protein